MDLFYWIIVLIGYLTAFYFLFYSFVIAISFFQQVPFVPLEKQAIKFALSLLNITKDDMFLDVGSGDGRVVRRVVRSFPYVSATGIEYNRLLNYFAKLQSVFYPNANLLSHDAYTFSYKKYNKIFIYLTSDMISKLLPKILKDTSDDAVIVSSYFSTEYTSSKIGVTEKKYRINGKIKSFFVITKNGNRSSKR